MAYGVDHDTGFIAATTATPAAGELEWESVSGVPPFDPIMSGGGDHSLDTAGYNPGRRFGSIQTLPAGQAPGKSRAHYGNWADILDFQPPPAPWVLLLRIAAIGLVHLRV